MENKIYLGDWKEYVDIMSKRLNPPQTELSSY